MFFRIRYNFGPDSRQVIICAAMEVEACALLKAEFLGRGWGQTISILESGGSPDAANKGWPSPSAEMCRGFLLYNFWRI